MPKNCSATLTLAGILIACSCPGSSAPAAEDDPEAAPMPRGVLLTLKAGERSLERIESDLSFVWKRAAPDERLPNGPFSARFDTQLLVRQRGEHTLHAYVQGSLKVTLADNVLLETATEKPDWVSGPTFEPDFGFQPLRIEFKKTQDDARLQLFWSSDSFPLEPIPPELLFRDGGRPELARIERGRQLFEANRCDRCHRQKDESPLSASAPPLFPSVAQVNTEWLVRKLSDYEGTHGRMPNFGFDANDALAIATELLHHAHDKQRKDAEKPKKLDSLPKPARGQNDDSDRKVGFTLLRSVGCLACHKVNDEGTAGPYSGPDLSRIAEKRDVKWLFTWLGDPDRLKPGTIMPKFTLTPQERRRLALALASLSKQRFPLNSINVNDQNLRPLGRKLIEQARCGSCHNSGLPEGLPLGRLVKADSDQGSCLSEKADRSRKRPAFARADQASIEAYIASYAELRSKPSAQETGQRTLARKNCTACHPRGTNKGAIASMTVAIASQDPSLRGLAPTLVPPSLTAVGDRLLNDALAKAVTGKQSRRLPWLKVQMPEIRSHGTATPSALANYLIDHDRIPDGAPGTQSEPEPGKINDQTLLLGQDLVGPKGFSCIACHQVGSYLPTKAAIGAKGSDLLALGKRMRYPYFIRWTRSPLRIVPGTEMPSYVRAVHGVLDDDVDRQLDTLWRSLNDDRFQPPTNPASVEQLLTVTPGDPARIVRDVFTYPEKSGGGYVARAFAVGFGNGHNVLLDLNSLELRQWTFGDLARQRTVGKSWYWDMAGVDVVSGSQPLTSYELIESGASDQTAVTDSNKPLLENGTTGRLLDYGSYQNGVQLSYRMNFSLDGELKPIRIEERLLPISARQTGWRREISVTSIPNGYDLLIRRQVDRLEIGAPGSVGYAGAILSTFDGKETEGPRKPFVNDLLRLRPNDGRCSVTLRYTSSLKRPPLDVKLKPLPAVPLGNVSSLPGFDGVRLPLSTKIMPTAMAVRADGALAFTSLEGHVYSAKDSDKDGHEDSLTMIEEGLAAPYGIIEDRDSLIISHKPELLRLTDTDGDGRADKRQVFATGWGFNDNYHDWTCGIVRDSKGNLYVGLGSNYGQPKRAKEFSLWRGSVVKVDPAGTVSRFSSAFRYPTGLAIDSQDRLFGSDNQGVQNCFNEINHLRQDHHFGVPNYHERDLKVKHHPPAVQVPHPWVRSVNGLLIFPQDYRIPQLAGHGIGCEYNEKLLVRFTYHEVDGTLQGATYYFSKPNFRNADENFLGPLSCTLGPDGELYIGSIHDSGWLGGLNTGTIVKLTPNGRLPNGIREIRATKEGFRIDFMHEVDRAAASKVDAYSVSGYTRVWGGSYSTPDSGRYQAQIESVTVADDGLSVELVVPDRKTGFVFDVNCKLTADGQPLWPDTGHYTLHKIPTK